MALVAGTSTTYDIKGIREDLSDVIYNISPDETPFMSKAGRGKAAQTFTEWQQDSLAAPDTANAQLEGDDAAFATPAPTVRVGNYTQISRKTLVLSDTEEVVDKAGRDSELAYQLAKRSKEIKLDMESIFLSNQAAVAGSSAVARKTGTIGAWIKTNTDKGATGADPVYTNIPNAARTDGTQRAFTETILKNIVQKQWTAGGTPKMLSVGGLQKQVVSGFAGIATKNVNQNGPKAAVIIGSADVYVSDFGSIEVVPNRFQRNRDAFLLDFEYIEVKYLRPFKTKELAKTGDAEKRMLVVEYCLAVKHEAALAAAYDLA